MNYSLVVNNSIVDMDANTPIPITLRASDAANIGEVLLSYTNTFLIPDTEYNKGILGNSELVYYNSQFAYNEIAAQLLIRGRNIFGKSRLILLDYQSGTGWNCSFIAGKESNALNGTIQEIDLSDLNWVYNANNYRDKRDSMTGVTTAYHRTIRTDLVRTNEIDISRTFFSVFYLELLVRIFQELDIQLIVKNQITDFFSRITLMVDVPRKIASEVDGWGFAATSLILEPLIPGGQTVLQFPNLVSGNEKGAYNTGTSVFTMPHASFVRVSTFVRVRINSNLAVNRFVRIRAGSLVNGSTLIAEVPIEHNGIVGTEYEVSVTAAFAYNQSNFSLNVEYSTPAGTDVLLRGSTFSIGIDNTLQINNTVDVARSLPPISKADFFKQISLLGNVVVQVRGDTLELQSFDRLQIAGVIDLSEQLDIEKGYGKSIRPEGFGKTTRFAWTNDDNNIRADIGSAEVTLNNALLEPFIEKWKLLFAFTEEVTSTSSFILSAFFPFWNFDFQTGPGTLSRAGGTGNLGFSCSQPHGLVVGDVIYIPSINRYALVNSLTSLTAGLVLAPTLAPFSSQPWEIIKFSEVRKNPRIGFITDLAPQTLRYLYPGYLSTQAIASKVIRSDGAVDSLYLDRILKRFFIYWLGSIEKYQLIKANFTLTDNDVFQVDFMSRYFVDYFGSNFYLSGINQYIGAEDSTELMLLKLGDVLNENQINPL